MISDLQEYLDVLRREKELCEISAPVDPNLEAAEIHRRVIEEKGPALLFTNIKGASFPVVTNLFGNEKRMELAFGSRPEDVVKNLCRLVKEQMPPTLGALWRERKTLSDLFKIGTARARTAPVLEVTEKPSLLKLPLLKTWELDGGEFFTLPLVFTEHPETKIPNLGIYRLQRFDDASTGFHCQIGKGAGFHLSEAKRLGRKLPVNVAVGGPPAVMIAAAAPLPENVPELLLASVVLGKKFPLAKSPSSPLPLFANAEFVFMGEVDPSEYRPEGPFGDHYGYYSLTHDYPVFRCHKVARRKYPIFTATVVGKGRQEDCYLGDYVQELLSPVFPLVMPAVKDLWAYGETGYHSLAAAVVKQQRYKREALSSAFRILGEGQLSLTKFLLVVEKEQNLKDFKSVLTHVLERSDFRTDLYVVSHTSMDTLDYTSTRVNEGSKGILLGLGEKRRDLPGEFTGSLPHWIKTAIPFCPGCLVIDGPSAKEEPALAEKAALLPEFSRWPLIIVADNARTTTQNNANFLWYTFTRFEPASDIKAKNKAIEKNHIVFHEPIVIDARMKPGYPEELFCDPETDKLVSRRWQEYFPGA